MRTFNLVKSLTKVNNITYLPFRKGLGLGRMLVLCLSLATFGVNEVWAWRGARVYVESEPTNGGWVWVTKTSGNAPSKWELQKDQTEEKDSWTTKAWSFTAYMYANPQTNYVFKGWSGVRNTNSVTYTTRTNCPYSAEGKSLVEYSEYTWYAIFARMTADQTSIAYGAKNVDEDNTATVKLTTVHAGDVNISLENNNSNYFSIDGGGQYSSVQNEETKTITVHYLPKAAGSHTATLQITGSNGMTPISIPLSGSAKSQAEMSWNPNTNVMNVGDLLTEENLTYSDGSRKIVFTTDNPKAVKINENGYPEAVGEGTANITAKQDGNESWYETSASQKVTVTNKQKQTIEWTDDLSFKFTGSTITQSLTATAESEMAITYSPTSGSFFTIENGQLKITGIGEAQLTATQAGNEDWVATSLTRRLVSRDPTATCDDPIYEGGEHTLKTIDSWEQDISSRGEPRTIQFKAKKSSNLAVGDGIKLHQFYDGDWHEVKNIARGDLGTDYKSFGPYDLNRKTTKIKFLTEFGSSLNRSFTDIFITRAKYLESKTNAIDFGNVGFGNTVSKQFTIDYSNIQGPLVTSCDNSCYTISPNEIGNDCGDYKKNVTVTVTFHATAAGQQNGKIHLTDEKVDRGGLELYIDVSANVTKTAQDITWEPKTTYNSTDKPTLSATATSGLAISSYSSDNESIAKVVNGNQLEFYGSGKVNITAHQDGNDFYEPASLTKEFTISKVTPTIVTLPTVGNAITYGNTLSDVALAGGSAKDDKGNAVAGLFEWVTPEEIPHGGQQNYTVRFVPDNTNMYASDAVSTETLTITVNKADQTLTWDVESPIKIKKEDGDYTLTASSTSGRAITYTLSDPSLGTINGNKLTPLKSGECAITAVCPADGDYNESNSIEKNLLIAGPDEIVWKYKEGDHVWAGQNLNAKGDLATAHTPVWFGKDETQWYLTVVNETNPKTVYTAIASDGTLVTISASTSGDDYYASISSSIQVYIDRCYQGLVWNQNFLSYLADEQGHIDQTEDLTAYAVDSLNKKTNLPIVYSIDNPDVAEIVGDATNGWKLHIKGAGSATLTASVDQTNIYQGVTETRKINVRKEGERCGSYALISTSEKNMNEINENTYMFDVPGETLTFKTRKFMAITLNTEITVEGWNNSTNVWEKIGTYTLDNTGNETKTYTLGENVRKVKITPKTTFESDYRYVSDLYVTQKEYLRTSINEINERIYINEDFSKVITIDHSDKPYINCVVDNDQLEIVRSGKESDCGEAGTLILTLKNKNNWNTPREINATITLTTSVGDNIRIPVQIQVQLGGTYKFTNAKGDGDWNNLQNWDYGGSVPTSLPDIMNPIEIQQPIRIDTEVKVYGLKVETEATQGWNGSVTIASTGGLTVYNGGVMGIDGKLTIESSREHTGYFRVVPDVVKNWVATPTATMQYASKGSLDSGANRDATWQYFGIPVNGADFTVDYITWLYEWSEPNGWIDLKSAAQPVHLTPFQGYAITQYGQPTYNFTGLLNMGKTDLHLTCTTTENGMWGDNMFANSFPSPIDVKLFTEEDFVNLDHKTIYLYNSGSWNDWNTGTQGGDWQHLTDGAGAPGTFTAIPALAAPYLGTAQTLIAPMQGMCIHTDNANGATVHLDYAKHVWDAMPTGSKDDMNAPLLTPARKASTDKPEGISDEVWEEVQYAQFRRDSIAEAHKQKVAELRHRVRLTVYGENSGVDHIYLLEKDGFTTDYDNGYDAYKMFNDGPLNLYTNEDFGQMAVSARNSIDSTYIGIEAGEDDVYQLIVSSVIGDSLLLFDTETSEIFALADSAVYTFYAMPNQSNDFRFRIIDYGKRTREQGHDTPTSWQDVNGTNVHIWYTKHKLYIADAQKNSLAHIYTANGTLVSTISFDNATSINVENLAAGVYIVHVDNTVYRFVTL